MQDLGGMGGKGARAFDLKEWGGMEELLVELVELVERGVKWTGYLDWRVPLVLCVSLNADVVLLLDTMSSGSRRPSVSGVLLALGMDCGSCTATHSSVRHPFINLRNI